MLVRRARDSAWEVGPSVGDEASESEAAVDPAAEEEEEADEDGGGEVEKVFGFAGGGCCEEGEVVDGSGGREEDITGVRARSVRCRARWGCWEGREVAIFFSFFLILLFPLGFLLLDPSCRREKWAVPVPVPVPWPWPWPSSPALLGGERPGKVIVVNEEVWRAGF